MDNSGESPGGVPATRHVRFKEILLIEEDETWALALNDALSEGGYRINLAASLQDAVRALRKKSTDLVLVSALLGESASEVLRLELESLKVPPPVLLVGTRPADARWRCWTSLPFVSSVDQPFQLPDVR